MNWLEAKSACEKLGDGWRLSTKEELNVLYKNHSKIGNFADVIYWSSTEVTSNNVWEVDFSASGFGDYYVNDKLNNWNVRAFSLLSCIFYDRGQTKKYVMYIDARYPKYPNPCLLTSLTTSTLSI
jgi:hypothetical protein